MMLINCTKESTNPKLKRRNPTICFWRQILKLTEDKNFLMALKAKYFQ